MIGCANSSDMALLIPGIFGLLGALIGGSTVLLSTFINHWILRKKELEALSRSRGEETLADLGALIAYGNKIVLDAIEGKITQELPPQMFRVWTNVELYYSRHTPLMIEMQKKLSSVFGTAAKGAQAIQANRLVVNEQSKVMLEAEKDFIRSSDALRKALVSELRVSPEKETRGRIGVKS